MVYESKYEGFINEKYGYGEEIGKSHYRQVMSVNDDHQDRIRKKTFRSINEKIDSQTESNIERVKAMGPKAIQNRLNEIDREWDIDRVLMLNFSVLVFAQLLMARRDRRWLWGPILQTPFLFMHSVLGWCPPSLWFRPMGFRTRKEIQSERETLLRYLLKPEPDYQGI